MAAENNQVGEWSDLTPEKAILIAKQITDHPRKIHENRRLREKTTEFTLGRVRVVYNGESYIAHLLETGMTKDGFAHWKKLYAKQIAHSKAMAYSQHLIKYGHYGQIPPPPSDEGYLTLNELENQKRSDAAEILSKVYKPNLKFNFGKK